MDLVGKVQKMRNNFFSRKVISTLGVPLYIHYLTKSIVGISQIVNTGDLRPIDKSMGRKAKQFHYRGQTFFFDCKYCDEHLQEDSYTFGIAREIYMRDCYFKWQPPWVYNDARIVVDLGANRGAFSTLMTTRAKFILSVEAQEQYAPIIRHNISINHFDNHVVETRYVGGGGALLGINDAMKMSFEEIFNKYDLKNIDVVKIDIEGSEFELFDQGDWLSRVGAISMEVHPGFGDPNLILRRMKQCGFTCVAADQNLQIVEHAARANFIYAWK